VIIENKLLLFTPQPMKLKHLLLLLIAASIITSCRNEPVKHADNSELNGDLIIFHAGSLSVPIRVLSDSFQAIHPGVTIKPESAGSLTSIRKITELKKECDILASADASMIDKLLMPHNTDWNLEFAVNEMALVYHQGSKYSGQVNSKNWPEMLLKEDIAIGRADPNSDPCGYRTVLSLCLAEKSMKKDGLADKIMEKDRRYIRPKEVDLLALLETNTVDYIFLYKSVAMQHKLPFIELSDSINLGDPLLNVWYSSVSVEIPGNSPKERITQAGEAMIYGLTIPFNSPNKEIAKEFVKFILSDKGKQIIRNCNQDPLSPARLSEQSKKPEWLEL
jgi:molybdate/tungstate transport system substrate-binding protein